MKDRTIVTADATQWLASHIAVGRRLKGAIVTSLPDAEEIDQPIEEWASWFVDAAGRCMKAVEDDQPVIFYQTDRKANGRLYSKAKLLFDAADIAPSRLLWHKIALRRDVGSRDLYRPTYTHLIAFSRKGKPGSATADVFDRGRTLYPNGMGVGAAVRAVQFASRSTDTIVDPFCGRGTVPAVANAFGLKAIGVDIDPQQTEKAGKIKLRRRP